MCSRRQRRRSSAAVCILPRFTVVSLTRRKAHFGAAVDDSPFSWPYHAQTGRADFAPAPQSHAAALNHEYMNTDRSAPGNVLPTAVIPIETAVFAGICGSAAICDGVSTTAVWPAGIVSVSQALPPT